MDAAPRETEAVAEPSGQSAPEGIESRSQLVLVVTENTELGNTLRSSLEPNSFSVTCVTDGTEALSQIQKAEVDFIVFDMAVSSVRADEFYQALEGIKPELRQRMIFITNDDVHPTLDAFVRRVRGLMLWQPFGLDELLHAARTFPKLECSEKV